MRPLAGRSTSGSLRLSFLRTDVVDQRADLVAAVTAHQRVDVGGILAPALCQQGAAADGIGLVPDGDVAVGNMGSISHVNLHCRGAPVHLGKTRIARALRALNYAAGN
jgi:hypothetical protein